MIREKFTLFIICFGWILWLDYSYASAAYGEPTVEDLSKIHSHYMKIIEPEWQRTVGLFSSKGEGSAKQWQILLDGGSGDCDDYAATFRAAVLKRHPNARTWLYIGKRFGGYHAIAVVEVSGVKYMMDNTRDTVLPLDEEFYDWKYVWKDNETGWQSFKG